MATQLQASVAHSGFPLARTTPVPDQLFDQFLPILSGAELKVYLYITRRTFGFRKDSDKISLSQMLQGITTRAGRILDRGTGLTKKTLLKALRSLEKKGLIHTERQYSEEHGHEPTLYHINILPLDHREASPPPLEEPVSQGLEEKLPQGLGEEIPPRAWGKNSPTQQTERQEKVLQETEIQDTDNNTAPDGAEGIVVAALQKQGLSKKVSYELAQQYPEDHILDKVDYVQWLIETKSPQAPKNPAGYLRRAVEEDYLPPPQYETHRARQEELVREEEIARRRAAESEEKARKLREAVAVVEQRHHAEQEHGIATEEYPPHPKEDAVWPQTLAKLKEQIASGNYRLHLENSRLLGLVGNTAIVEVANHYSIASLERIYGLIVRALSDALGWEVGVEFVAAQPEGLAADD